MPACPKPPPRVRDRAVRQQAKRKALVEKQGCGWRTCVHCRYRFMKRSNERPSSFKQRMFCSLAAALAPPHPLGPGLGPHRRTELSRL